MLFFRLALLRLAIVMFVWGAITTRAGYSSSGVNFVGSCDALDKSAGSENEAGIGSCYTVRSLVIVLTAGALYMLLIHGGRLFLLGGPSLWRSACKHRMKKAPHVHLRPVEESYIAGYSGSFGRFYVSTLVLASVCICTAGLVDLSYGWSNASVLYAIGGFFA